MKPNKADKQLISTIEKLRNELITTGMKNGFECSKVIYLSQKLDSLIYEFQKQPTKLKSNV